MVSCLIVCEIFKSHSLRKCKYGEERGGREKRDLLTPLMGGEKFFFLSFAAGGERRVDDEGRGKRSDESPNH